MASHSSTLAWQIPWTDKLGRLSDFTFSFHFRALEKEMAPTAVLLPGESQGRGEPGGLPSVGLHRVGHNRNDLAAADLERS